MTRTWEQGFEALVRQEEAAVAKYHNRKTVTDGITFASQAEARRYAELRLLAAAGAISSLVLQPAFELQPAFTDATGTRHRAIRYVGDFAFTEDGRYIVEDVKGMQTREFRIKVKLLLKQYPTIELRTVQV